MRMLKYMTCLTVLLLLLGSTLLILPCLSATPTTTESDVDNERVVIEDLSHELRLDDDWDSPYYGSTGANSDDPRGGGKKKSGGGGGAKEAKKKKEEKKKKQKKGTTAQGDFLSKEIPATKEAVTEGIEKTKNHIEVLSSQCADYRKVLHDEAHIDAVSQRRSDIFTDLARLYTTAQKAEQDGEGKTFKPLVEQILKLHRSLNKIRDLITDQTNLHLDLMKRTQELLPYYKNESDKANVKALRSYIKLRIKKEKPSSKENLKEMEQLQRTVRGQFILGLTWSEIRWFLTAVAVPAAVLILLQPAIVYMGWVRHASTTVSLTALTITLIYYYPSLIGSISRYLTIRHRLAHVGAGVCVLLFLGALISLIEAQVRIWVYGMLMKQRSGSGRRLRD